ncbi:cation:proton antiporter [Streptomyces fagopyri]|uniref:cation:proton antiporter n=1 Tax=Streptomyces fagopyri TaxID=2662397 RepID=UPI0033FFD041
MHHPAVDPRLIRSLHAWPRCGHPRRLLELPCPTRCCLCSSPSRSWSLACQAGGRAVRLLGQPPVIGEILAGILLGPSLLGWLAPSVQHHILPPSVLPITSALGNLGLLAFLFLIGLELDLRSLGTTRGSVAAVSLSGVLLPMALGAALASALYPHFAPDGVGRLPSPCSSPSP